MFHATRTRFAASGPFEARTDFTHNGVEYKAGAPFVSTGLAEHDLYTLWRSMLIDVAGPKQASPEPAKPVAPPELVAAQPPAKPTRAERRAARS